MDVRFAHWLARPSSLCFLRRVLATTDQSGTRRFHASPRRSSDNIGTFLGVGSVKTQGASAVQHCSSSQSNETRLAARKEQQLRSQDDGNIVTSTKVVGDEQKEGDGDEKENPVHTVCTDSNQIVGDATMLEDETTTIRAYEALWYQHSIGQRPILAEVRLERDNMQNWVELLQLRQRLDGFAGINEVWKGMRFRQIDLPVSGPEADFLWSTFLQVCIMKNPNQYRKALYESILEHAKDIYARHNVVWPGLYKYLVGKWLRFMPSQAKSSHRFLCDELGVKPPALNILADDFAANPEPVKARKYFKAMYRDSGPQEGLYDSFIPKLVSKRGDWNALQLHKFFLGEGQGPSAEIFALPEVQHLFELDGDKSLPMVHRRRQTDLPRPVPPSATAAPTWPPLTRATMSMLVGEVHGIKPKELSDAFIARLFATQAFSLGFVIQGIGILGVDKLGPLAIHEMAVKAKDAKEFRERTDELTSMGISCNKSAYGRLALNIATRGQDHLFSALLASDQHPEAYDDVRTQEMLLLSFLRQRDTLNAELTFLALSLGGVATQDRAWNRLLQLNIEQKDYSAVDRTFRQMQDSKMKLSGSTLDLINWRFLPHRISSRGPRKGLTPGLTLKPLQIATNAYIYAAESGLSIYPGLWVELFKRYGMTERWDECERLAYWLMSWYGRPASSGSPHTGSYNPRVLARIFDSNLQKALIYWSIRQAGHRKLLRKIAPHNDRSSGPEVQSCEQWARGLLLVERLKDHGVPVSYDDIRAALKFRFISLFGPAFSCRNIVEEIREHNKLTLADYIRHANHICRVNLFSIDPELLKPDNPDHSELMVHVFGRWRRIGPHGYADIAAFAREQKAEDLRKKEARLQTARLSTGRKAHLWSYSPFRLVRNG